MEGRKRGREQGKERRGVKEWGEEGRRDSKFSYSCSCSGFHKLCGVLEWGVEGGRRRGYELERFSRR